MSAVTTLADVLPAEALADRAPSGGLAGLADGAEAVVRPGSTEEVVEVVTWAAAAQVGVLIVGSGARARRAAREGRYVVLTTERLSGFEIYEPADLTLTAKAGTPLADIEAELRKHRQWLPFDPPHVSERTLGGLVATGVSGPVGTGYGELRSHVLGATVVCGDGRALRLGGRVVKNVAGFDLLRPVVGSNGRLGVVTSVCLRAFPLPAEDRVLAHRARAAAELAEVARAVRTAPILPVSVTVWAPGRSDAVLLVRLHGAKATVDADQRTLEAHAGVSFEVLHDAAVLDTARDGAAAGALTVHLSLLPSKLFDGLAAARRRLGDVDLFADAYGGSARLAVDVGGASELRALRSDIEDLGGVLAVDSADPDSGAGGVGSRASDAEAELAERLEQVFDPPGVFWPCRA